MDEFDFGDINLGSNVAKKRSEYLPLALSANQKFFYTVHYFDAAGNDSIVRYSNITEFIPKFSKIEVDSKNDIFIGKFGAVADAYHLDENLDEKALDHEKKEILMGLRLNYPDYNFTLEKGTFPLQVKHQEIRPDGLTDNVEMANYILYIKDYTKHLEKPKINSKK